MLISALCDYYNDLARDGKVVPEGYSKQAVHYLIALNPDGTIDNLINWQLSEKAEMKNGKVKERLIPRSILLPLRSEKSGIDFNMIEHRPLYIFGLNFTDNGFSADDRTDKARKSHTLFREESLKRISGLDTPIVNAFRAFLETWIPEQETDNPMLLALGKAYKNSYFAFCLSGHPEILLHEDKAVNEVWKHSFEGSNQLGDCVTQCAVTGEAQPIARIHNKIKGVAGGQPSGTVLVGFKTSAGWSYGNEQSYNSNISEQVMKKYTYALNYLLSDRAHKQQVDDITVVFWASGGEKNEICTDYLNYFLFGGSEKLDEKETEKLLKSIMRKASEGRASCETFAAIEDIDDSVDFYIVGIKPNSSRLSLKFIYRRKIGAMLNAVAQHQSDMQLGSEYRSVPLWRIKKELKSPKSDKENIDASLMSAIFKSIIYGTPYPTYLLSGMVTRIKTDRAINAVRAGVVKACLNRQSRASRQKEELQLALDKQNTNQAYLCGRLFAVLEHIQQSAASAKLNRTIKDAYFSSAASKPALVFPKLITLSQNHLKKLSESGVVFYSKLVEEIIGKLNGEFPDTLMLKDQGRFMIGYYQQDQAFFQKQTDDQKEEQSL